MKSTEKERVKKVIYWILSQGIVDSQEQLAETMGYNSSSFSQIVSGKKPVSKKFIKNLCKISEKINEIYLLDGIGCMILDSAPLNLSGDIGDERSKSDIIQILNREIERLHGYNAFLTHELERKDNRITELTDEIIKLKNALPAAAKGIVAKAKTGGRR